MANYPRGAYTSFAFLACDDLEAAEQHGKITSKLLSGLTGDITANKLMAMYDDNHPMFTDQAAGKHYALIGINSTHQLITDYLAEKEIQPALTIDKSDAMQRHVENILKYHGSAKHHWVKDDVCRRTMPTVIAEAYAQAKTIANEMAAEHGVANIRGV